MTLPSIDDELLAGQEQLYNNNSNSQYEVGRSHRRGFRRNTLRRN